MRATSREATMDRITDQEKADIIDDIKLTETWVKMQLQPGLGKQLIEAKLGDLLIQVGTGEIPDYVGL